MAVVSRETLDRLNVYSNLVERWNPTIKLVSTDVARHLAREVEDSWQLVDYLDPNARSGLDIGSGSGLPGLPIAIVRSLQYTLVEADRRKAAFLREAGRLTAAAVDVVSDRIENVRIRSYDIITSRAFASLDRLFEVAEPRQHRETVCIFPKGEFVDEELTSAERRWRFVARLEPARRGSTVIVRNIARREDVD